MATRPETATPDWLRPPAEQAGLSYYVEVARERWLVIVAAIGLCIAGAVVYLALASKSYEAEADLLITPASPNDELLTSLGVMHSSSDPTSDVETAAKLVTTVDVANRVRRALGSNRSATSLLKDVSAAPVGQSAIVAVTAHAPSATAAADLANAFAKAAVAERTARLHDRIDQILPQVQAELQGGGTAQVAPGASLRSEYARLQFLRSVPDPTISVETTAVPPASPASPKPKLTLGAAGLAGLVLGIGAAFAAQTLDPRLRREQQLRARYQLPILARVPRQSSRRGRPLSPTAVTPPAREAYRALRANITAARVRSGEPQAVLITGSAPAEGKTTTAVNLATSLAMAGSETILIEADLRRPAIADTLGIAAETGVVSTLLENASLRDSLITMPLFPHLKLLLADYRGGWVSELFSLDAAQHLVTEAKRIADFVVIDSPPLTAVVDALPLARQADDVVMVTRLGVTRLDKLQELAELLAANNITPLGFALIGTPHPERGYSYYAGSERPGEGLPTAPRQPEPARGEGTKTPGGEAPRVAAESEDAGRRARTGYTERPWRS